MSDLRLAQFQAGTQTHDLYARADKGVFATREEAEAAAKQVADSANQDAVVVAEGEQFRVYGVDEISAMLPAGAMGGNVIREAPIVSFVISDPLTGQENVIGPRSQASEAPQAPPVMPKTQMDAYAERFGKKLDKLLGADKAAVINELNQLQHSLAAQGISVSIELDDDVFENKDKIMGFRNMLVYAHENIGALRERSISKIAIVDEWDNFGGTHVELDYDKKAQSRTLEIGDDFLDDWGESLTPNHAKSLNKLKDELGATLKPEELVRRTEVSGELRGALAKTHQTLNTLQQQSLQGAPADLSALAPLEAELTRLEKDVIPQAHKDFKGFSVRQERQASVDYLKKLEDTLRATRDQIETLRKLPVGVDPLELNARLERIKLTLLKGMQDQPVDRNYLGTYVSGFGEGAAPSAGLTYSHSFGKDLETVGSLKAGTTGPSSLTGSGKSDIMLGLGVSHTFHSHQRWLDGANVGIGVGVGRDTPFFVGVSASNSWYLSPYHGQKGEWSVVGGAHATLGTSTNVGVYTQVEKQLTSRIDFEGSGELSLWNQGLEAEAEFALGKSKNVYLTAGVGTNKLLYAGIGFADKYELEAGLGGISFGKDSNNLPGETGWEVGLRSYLPIPYFKHHRVPGYQFTYGDKSTEYVTPAGTFMTMKKDADGVQQRTSYVPDPQPAAENNRITYRIARAKADVDNLGAAPVRDITIGPLGYLTVKDGDKTLIEDGLIVAPDLTEADLGIITDQAGVLWFDKRNRSEEKNTLGTRRREMPLPLYRAVHR
jgi:hypothetical protein